MLNNLTPIHTDELAVSWIHRIFQINAFELADIIQTTKKNYGLGSYLRRFRSDCFDNLFWLNYWIKNVDLPDLLLNHTYFKLITMIQKEEAADVITQRVLGSDPALNSCLQLNLRGNGGLTWCPECKKQEEDAWGYSILHVSHQVRGMRVCPIHGCSLIHSAIPANSYQVKSTKSLCDRPDETELKYARFIYDLLRLPDLISFSELRNLIKITVIEKFGSYQNLHRYLQDLSPQDPNFSIMKKYTNIAFKTIVSTLLCTDDFPVSWLDLLACLIDFDVSLLASKSRRKYYDTDLSKKPVVYTAPLFSGMHEYIQQHPKASLAEVFHGAYPDYELLSITSSGKTVEMRHLLCQKTFKTNWYAFFTGQKRCTCEEELDFEAAARLVAQAGDGKFQLLSWQPPGWAYIQHEDHSFSMPTLARFLGLELCPICQNKETKAIHPSEKRFIAKMQQLTGEEYQIKTHWKGTRKQILFLHDKKHGGCGREFETAPDLFLNGVRCPHCHLMLSRKSFNKSIYDFSDGFLRLEKIPNTRGWFYLYTPEGNKFELTLQLFLQEAFRPTPSPYFSCIPSEHLHPERLVFSPRSILNRFIHQNWEKGQSFTRKELLNTGLTKAELDKYLSDLSQHDIISYNRKERRWTLAD